MPSETCVLKARSPRVFCHLPLDHPYPNDARLLGRGVDADRYTDEKDSMYGWTSMNDSVTRSRVSYGLGFKLCQVMSETKSDLFLIDNPCLISETLCVLYYIDRCINN